MIEEEKNRKCSISSCPCAGTVAGLCPFHFSIDLSLSGLVTKEIQKPFCAPGKGEGTQSLTRFEALNRNRQLWAHGAMAFSDVVDWYGREIHTGAILVREWLQLKASGALPQKFLDAVKSSNDLFKAINDGHGSVRTDTDILTLEWICRTYEDLLIEEVRNTVTEQADRMGLRRDDSKVSPEEALTAIQSLTAVLKKQSKQERDAKIAQREKDAEERESLRQEKK